MKRIVLSIILIFTAVLAMAGNVTPEKARQTAASFFSQTRGGASVELVWDGTDGATRAAGAPAFYVFNNAAGGFVVIAGEDAATPILGFSKTGSFTAEGMPVQIRGFFDEYTREINYLRSTGHKQTAACAELWERAANEGYARYTSVKELHTPTWGQSAPFNNLCPVVDGGRSLAGCVAVAISEVMFYHRWPLTTTGEKLPDYSYNSDKGTKQSITGHNLATSYNWDKMLSKYDYTATPESNLAVATLMHDIGVMMESDYNPTGTGAMSEDITPRLVKYMDYDSSMFLLYREELPVAEWCAKLRAEIDANRPILYSGTGEGGGHQFVVDGYATDDFFYVNWGWNGSDNGFFKISSFMTGFDYDFRAFSSAIFSMKPQAGGKSEEILRYFVTQSGTSLKGGISLASGKVAKGNTVSFELNNISNDGLADIEAWLAMAVVDYKDQIKKVYGNEAFSLASGYGIGGTFGVTIDIDLELGDRFMAVYRTSSNPDWKPIKMDPYYIKYIIDAYPAYSYPAIALDPSKTYQAGDVIDLVIMNHSRAPEKLTWYYDSQKVAEDTYCITLTSGRHTLRVDAKFGTRTETLYQVINVQ